MKSRLTGSDSLRVNEGSNIASSKCSMVFIAKVKIFGVATFPFIFFLIMYQMTSKYDAEFIFYMKQIKC